MPQEKPLILIIEDEYPTALLLSEILHLKGYRTHWCKDGLNGLQTAGKTKPALILLDLRIPGLEGADVLDRLKAEPSTRDIPVLICSAADRPEDVRQCLERGALGCIAKPFHMTEVCEAVRTALEDGDDGRTKVT